MLNLRILRGPLPARDREAILGHYNRLTSSRIPMNEFVRWLEQNPAGAACHAILDAQEGEIVGHTSLIPLRTHYRGARLVPAKVEYSFLREDFRAAKIRGFESSALPTFLIMKNQLLRHCDEEGWGPFFISTSSSLYPLARLIGCRRTDFPLWECLLVLRPWQAARRTPHLTGWQRAILCSAGLAQRSAWAAATAFSRSAAEVVPATPNGDCMIDPQAERISFFEDQASQHWRYPADQYARLSIEAGSAGYVVVKKGSEDRYVRACQWRLDSGQPSFSVVATFVRMARATKAPGVRWAIYGDDAHTARLVSRIRKLGFLCVRRVRTLLVRSKSEELRSPENWNLTDSLFSFDP